MAWQWTDTAPEGVPVLTKIDDGLGARNEQPLTRRGRLWWLVDESMYVYYTPTHWKPLDTPSAGVDEGAPVASTGCITE